MYEPENFDPINENDSQPGGPTGFSGETDRVNGEYHYKNGYTQKIYSDAHYVPYSENTVPPRYYTPPERPVREQKAPRQKKSGGFFKTLCLCLVCALLGGIAGGAVVSGRLSARIDALEAAGEQQEEMIIGSQTQQSAQTTENLSGSGALPASLVYENACTHVVGITTEVTYTNFFGMSSSSAVSGSGFIVSEEGYILTNYHVIEYAYKGNTTVDVILHDGTRYDAVIIGVEEDNDVAVLKVEAAGLTPAAFGDSDNLKVGDTVYAVGNPLGELEFSMSTGNVSALDRLITTEENSDAINMFQIDAAVNSGNSGGPVYNNKGEVIGIVTAKYSDTGVEGLGFAIPINDAAKIANDLITKGYVTGKAYLGVTVDTSYNSMYSQYYGLPLGAFVDGVEKGSCAEAAGLQAGDIITAIGEYKVESYNDLKQALKAFSAGETAEIVISRADRVTREDQSLTLTVTFDEAQPDTISESKRPVSPSVG